MPSGRVHNLINLISFTLLGSGTLAWTWLTETQLETSLVLAFTTGYFAGTYLLSPDLDLANGYVSAKRAWGILGFIWVPYGLLFSHRGWSHSWLIGPLTRIIYLGLIVVLSLALLGLAWPPLLLLVAQWTLAINIPWSFLLALLLGYYLSQWLHLFADGIRPDHKMRWQPRNDRKGNRKRR